VGCYGCGWSLVEGVDMTYVFHKDFEEAQTRWQQVQLRDNYMELQSFSSYLMAMSRMAAADCSFAIARDLVLLSNAAHQRAVDLEPKHELEAV
jgi:hypothetical protein